jgi:hypothetical protein
MLTYKVAGFGILLVAVVALWHTDRKAQYKLGTKDALISFQEKVNEARNKRDAKASSVSLSAADAAKRVCVEAGIEISECQF